MADEIEDDILRSLRRITRAIDLYSRRLAGRFGLTGPQLVCLRALAAHEPTTPSALSRQVDLSQATMTGIVDRLESRGLLTRQRDDKDRRRVMLTLTPAGRQLIERSPSALQESLLEQLSLLPNEEQAHICETLRKVVRMMGAEDIDAAPLLATGPAHAQTEDVANLLADAEQPEES